MLRRFLSCLAVMLPSLLIVLPAQADPISGSQLVDVGGSFTLQGLNAPTSFSESVTIGNAPVLVAGGTLSVTMAFVADGPDAEWIQIRVATVEGGPIGVPTAPWRYDYVTIPFVTPVSWDRVTFNWEADGAAFNPINSFGGIIYQGNTSVFTGEPVYGGDQFGPVTGLTSLDLFASSSPYSFINAGGNNANTADAFVATFHIINERPVVTTPEPASLMLVGIGAVGLFGAGRRRRQKPAI